MHSCPGNPTVALGQLLVCGGSHATPGHVDERAGVLATLQGKLDATQEIVGLEQEKHLPRDFVEEGGDFWQVGRYRFLYQVILNGSGKYNICIRVRILEKNL